PIPIDSAAPYDAAVNTTRTLQQGYGAAAQLAVDRPIAGRENHLFAGAGLNDGRANFSPASALAPLAGSSPAVVSRGTVAAASRVARDSFSRDLGVYLSDTFSARRDLFVSAAARFNLSSLSLADQRGGALSGDHDYLRLNPALGVSYQPRPVIGGYA